MIARCTGAQCRFAALRFTNIVKREKFDELPWSYTEDKPYPVMFWPWSHEDDVIEAHMAAVTVPDSQLFQGLAENEIASFLLAAPSTRFKESTKELLIRHYGEEAVSAMRGDIPEGNDSFFVLDKAAEAAINWKPRCWKESSSNQ